jgi:enamine deaminase RidA (YjgF/YER057c/UK114 family)
MVDVKYIAPTRIGGTDIEYAQGVRAGSWLFFTGHMASDFEHGLAAEVTGKPGLPRALPPRYRREGDFIIGRFAKLIAAEGGDLRHIVRVDQYYPDAQVVNAYQRARKAVLKDFVPPSTMPNNEEMTGIAKPAYRPPNAVWNGTDIRLQTEFLITSRLKPALEAGGSSIKNAIKAQVYLTNIEDLPEFLDVWNSHFGGSPCALTVVATKGLALLESIIEINIFGVRDGGKIKKEIVEHKPSAAMRLGPAAVRAGDLFCLSALYAADADGAIAPARQSAGLKYFGAPAQHEMRAILGAADEICRAGGVPLDNLVRANHFVGDLDLVYPALRVWQEKRKGAPIPFGAVRTPSPMPIPGCNIIADMWVYAP